MLFADVVIQHLMCVLFVLPTKIHLGDGSFTTASPRMLNVLPASLSLLDNCNCGCLLNTIILIEAVVHNDFDLGVVCNFLTLYWQFVEAFWILLDTAVQVNLENCY